MSRRSRTGVARFAHGAGCACNRIARHRARRVGARARRRCGAPRNLDGLAPWQILPGGHVHFWLERCDRMFTTGTMASDVSEQVSSATYIAPGDGARPLAGAPKKVLVVDDEPETAGGLAEILREDGYHVEIVH